MAIFGTVTASHRIDAIAFGLENLGFTAFFLIHIKAERSGLILV
jgi:hypothetical protein